MARALGLALLLILAAARPAAAIPPRLPRVPDPAAAVHGSPTTDSSLDNSYGSENTPPHSVLVTTGAPPETTWFGGTVWAADSMRWEAIPGGTWTFDSGVGSSLVTAPGGPKPVGYHRTFEGWSELDFTDPKNSPQWRRSSTCALSGNGSAWLGRTAVEAAALCYVAGQGFGPNWNAPLVKTFNYPGSGSVTVEFDASVQGDALYLYIDNTGTATNLRDYHEVGYVSDAWPDPNSFVLTPGQNLRTTAGPFRLLLLGSSDNAYDDFDGRAPTDCGLAVVDNIRLTGAVADFSDFETSLNGWNPAPGLSGSGGLWGDMAALSALPPPPGCTINFSACSMADSVLLFHDTARTYWAADPKELAVSPWIDLQRAGVTSVGGLVVDFGGYWSSLPLQYVYRIAYVQWAPTGCPTPGAGGLSEWVPLTLYNGSTPSTGGCTWRARTTDLVPAGARMVRVGLGLESDCSGYASCESTQPTLWYDNVRVGVTSASVPALLPSNGMIDTFAQDGTLNPASTARIDGSGDTLVCGTTGLNCDVRIAFRVRPGPFTSTGALAAWATAKWTAAPEIGPGWWTARMDTAESNGQLYSSYFGTERWMSTLHESDPKFGGGTDTDRGGDGDPGELAHDIFPDHLLTPGSRIDYFFSARYLPPDPRNPAGEAWSLLPDTTGGHYWEMEVLPSSMTVDSTWNCVLLIPFDSDYALEIETLRQALGAGGTNPEGTRFDRLDRTPARESYLRGGATPTQLAAYGTIIWQFGGASMSDANAALFNTWLAASTPANPRRLWAAGQFLARSLDQGSATQQLLLRQKFGGRYSTSLSDFPGTCLSLANAPGAAFALPGGAGLRHPSGCSSYGLACMSIDPGAAATARALTLNGPGGPILALTNEDAVSGRRTILESTSLGRLRRSDASCENTLAAYEHASALLGWLGQPNGGHCTPSGVSDAGDPPPTPAATPGELVLERAIHHPGDTAWRLSFVLPVSAPVTLRLFDIAGRAVITLLGGEPLAAGRHEVAWDGRTGRGGRVAPGIYMLRLGTPTGARTQKLVVRPN